MTKQLGSRWWSWRTGIPLVVVFLVGVGWLNRPQDDPAHATPEDAVRSFRAAEGGAEGGAEGPPAGVYRYLTKGSESVDAGFFGTSHGYDGVSTVTVAAEGCGTVERWQVLVGRWAEVETCAGARSADLRRVSELHEFFGSAEEDHFSCGGPWVSDPPSMEVGASFASRCEAGANSLAATSRIADLATVGVDGEDYPAVRTVTRILLRGEDVGVTTIEDWRRRQDGLLLRRAVTSQVDADGTDYSEDYTLALIDPEPQR